MSQVWGQYSHVGVSGWALDLQVRRHVAFLTTGPQAEIHFWRPLNLRTQTPHWWEWSPIANVYFSLSSLNEMHWANVTFHGSSLRRSRKSSPKIDARTCSSFSSRTVCSSVATVEVCWLLILLHGSAHILSHSHPSDKKEEEAPAQHVAPPPPSHTSLRRSVAL